MAAQLATLISEPETCAHDPRPELQLVDLRSTHRPDCGQARHRRKARASALPRPCAVLPRLGELGRVSHRSMVSPDPADLPLPRRPLLLGGARLQLKAASGLGPSRQGGPPVSGDRPRRRGSRAAAEPLRAKTYRSGHTDPPALRSGSGRSGGADSLTSTGHARDLSRTWVAGQRAPSTTPIQRHALGWRAPMPERAVPATVRARHDGYLRYWLTGSGSAQTKGD
jgi:hypothetical protein